MMGKRNFALGILLSASSLATAAFDIYVGPHHNYTRLNFNNPVKLDGFMAGLTGGMQWSRRWFFADANYEGYWTTGPIAGRKCQPCERSKVREHLAQLKLGVHAKWCDGFDFDIYTGFGFNHYSNRQDPAANGGLHYQYTKLNIPVGFSINHHCTDYTTVALHAEWRPDVFARLEMLGHHLDIDRSHAARVQMPISHQLKNHDRFVFCFTPFFDWNRFGKVNETNCNGTPFNIPKLTRWNTGMRLACNIQF